MLGTKEEGRGCTWGEGVSTMPCNSSHRDIDVDVLMIVLYLYVKRLAP